MYRVAILTFQGIAAILYIVAISAPSFERVEPDDASNCPHTLGQWATKSKLLGKNGKTQGNIRGLFTRPSSQRCGSYTKPKFGGQLKLKDDRSQFCLDSYDDLTRAHDLGTVAMVFSMLTIAPYSVFALTEMKVSSLKYWSACILVLWFISTITAAYAYKTLLGISLTTSVPPEDSSNIVCAGTYKRNVHTLRLWIAGIILSAGVPLDLFISAVVMKVRPSGQDGGSVVDRYLSSVTTTELPAYNEHTPPDGNEGGDDPLPSYEDVTRGGVSGVSTA
eukprot:m.35294 g.35294  ORF g.35294 m.35294 type:complete len:277 (+) comp12379_c0_seq2:82-912(+)